MRRPEPTIATIRVRPLRLGFLMKPDDPAMLLRVIEVNTCLWGGRFNFIIPVFGRTPKRYRDRYLPGPTTKQLRDGIIEAFEPDFLVETQAGIAAEMEFPKERIIGFDDLFRRDEHGRGGYGLTLVDICAALYDETFRFVQRHPQRGDYSSSRRSAPCSSDRRDIRGASSIRSAKPLPQALRGSFGCQRGEDFS